MSHNFADKAPKHAQRRLETGDTRLATVDAQMALVTVYRNIKALTDAGEISAASLPGDNPRYESALHEHHHHFQRTHCMRVFDVHDCPGDLAGLAPAGFTIERHGLTLYGSCNECAAPEKTSGKAKKAHVHRPSSA